MPNSKHRRVFENNHKANRLADAVKYLNTALGNLEEAGLKKSSVYMNIEEEAQQVRDTFCHHAQIAGWTDEDIEGVI